MTPIGAKKQASLTRRSLIVGGIAFASLLSACRDEDIPDAAMEASAARGTLRQGFKDAVGWIEPESATAVIVFVPWHMTEEQRRTLVENRSVYPALPTGEPILEMRLEIKPGDRKDVSRINVGTLRGVQFTFWYFDEPAPVIRVEQAEWQPSPDMEVVGLDGELKKGGWVVGTLRGKNVYRNTRNIDEAYLWNVKFVQSLI